MTGAYSEVLRTTLARIAAFCALTLLVAQPAQAQPPVGSDLQFRRGVNILGYDPLWSDASKGRFQLKHFEQIRQGGFDFVRVNMFVFKQLDASGRISSNWLKRLDWVVASATDADLGVVLDVHDFGTCSKDVANCRVKLLAIWGQLAERYGNAPRSVAFELLNEPHGEIDSETWNLMIRELLPIVRATNPHRWIVVGPTKHNSLDLLPQLRLPEHDRNILVTFHYYGPYRFTHQGAPWTKIKDLRGVSWGSAADRRNIWQHFAQVASWAKAHRRPVLLGEFGVFDRGGVPTSMRADYVATLRCEAERHGFGWAYWQFDGNFIVWDMKDDSWFEPIKRALIPARPEGC